MTAVVASDLDVARHAADAAARVLLAERGTPGTDLARRGDAAAQRAIVDVLARAAPSDLILSEEASDPAGRDECERVWIVDPLDGTREFAEAGRSDWAVHVALWTPSGLSVGVVALPGRKMTLTSADVRTELTTGDRGPRPIRVAVSRSRPPDWLSGLHPELDLRIEGMGSAGAKTAAVVLGEVDAYVHSGGQFEWDSAAPVAVAMAAGLHCSRIDGSPLRYNQPDPWLPDLVVCRPELARPLIEAMAAAQTSGTTP